MPQGYYNNTGLPIIPPDETKFEKGYTPWNKGKKLSKEISQNMSKVRMGIKLSKEHCKKISKGRKGIKFSEKHKKTLSTSHLGIKHSDATKLKMSKSRKGKKHWNWQGGSSFEPYPLGWTKTHKEQIRYRDGYKCQMCGVPEVETGKRLDVHHIDYDKDNIEPPNLISLCRSCHTKTNTHRKYWINYFDQKISKSDMEYDR